MERDFEESCYSVIRSLNRLMQDERVSRDTKVLLKINRFKLWVSGLIEEKEPTTNQENE